MMKNFLFLVILAATAIFAVASSKPKVIVYDGPTECSNIAGENPTKIETDYIAGLHFTVTIDESSTGSRDTIGRKIESSHDVGIAPSFAVGQGKVIEGLDQGLIGLCKGSSAYIIVPPHLGYGRMGKPEQGVMGDTTLRYDVEIADVQPPVPNDFVKIDTDRDWRISKKEAKKYFEGLGQVVDLDSLWDDEDENVDGYISWEEFKGPKGNDPPPKKQKKQRKKQHNQQQQQEQTEQVNVAALFQNMDTDKDGKLSKAELAVFFKTMGEEMTEDFWAQSDPDGDGYVLFEEFIGDNDQTRNGEEL
mmetsp:Transcript_22133/g.48088  ORF Transcript_22133/g.48088 Transcript_22133/m.48088 type:complete len:304 (+) Transcript_22133:26-937(+)